MRERRRVREISNRARRKENIEGERQSAESLRRRHPESQTLQ